MVTRLKDVDAVTVGLGWTGAILARELTKAGLNVVSLERGPDRIPGEDFILPAVRDEERYAQRLELMMDNSIDTLTFRNFPNDQALPIRRIGAFLPGEGVGGSGIHWGALHWRFLPADFRIRSALTERYGANSIPEDMTIQDWPVSYDELEPFYDSFDKICGVSGKAGNLRGKKIEGGNVFERADQIEQCRPDVRRGGKEPRLSPVPGAGGDRQFGVYQRRRRGARRLRILRLLQSYRV
jgi:gluconate 2-dehydrogenase alpha chain